jgi:uncharacterized repeat protein (TIGR04076 family)
MREYNHFEILIRAYLALSIVADIEAYYTCSEYCGLCEALLSYRVRICVEEVRGRCAMGYWAGVFIIEKYYITDVGGGLCLHALCSMLTLLMPFLKGVSAKALGIGREDDIGYVQCPDPGEPYTCGGTVVFELRRERIGEV